MSNIKKFKVEVKLDHLSRLAAGSPEAAIAEMIWNALDADATKIDVRFSEGVLGVDEVIVTDNGSGIPYEQVESLFVALGGSWKAQKQKTREGRFLHGKDGEGRFKAFVLGRVVDWNIIYEVGRELRRYAIEGLSDSLDEFSLTDEEVISAGHSGVEVRITELSKKFHVLARDKAIERLAPIFALYLSKYPMVNLSFDGKRMNIAELIRHKQKYALPTVVDEGSDYPVELEILEWNDLKERELWFCDAHGFPLELCNRQIRGIGDFGFSAYLKSKYFESLHAQGLLVVGGLNAKLIRVCP